MKTQEGRDRLYRVESEFTHRGLKCVVTMNRRAYRCGYVGVPKGHPLFGKDYDDYLDMDEDERVSIYEHFQVHGGITYANGGVNSEYPVKSDLWWFGFDCAHAWDARDFDSAKKLFKDDVDAVQRIEYIEALDGGYQIPGQMVRSLEYVQKECMRLAEQLAELMEDGQ